MNSASLLSARNVLRFSLVAEGLTGFAALLAPEAIAQLLFGSNVAGVGIAFGRLAGIALLALVFACWPSTDAVTRSALHAVLAYNLLAALYLAYLGSTQSPTGVLLWPAAAEHALVALVLTMRLRD